MNEDLIGRIRNASFYEEPYNMLNDVQVKRIIKIILDDVKYAIDSWADHIETNNGGYVNYSEVMEAIDGIREVVE